MVVLFSIVVLAVLRVDPAGRAVTVSVLVSVAVRVARVVLRAHVAPCIRRVLALRRAARVVVPALVARVDVPVVRAVALASVARALEWELLVEA